jgi:hypothetical protein
MRQFCLHNPSKQFCHKCKYTKNRQLYIKINMNIPQRSISKLLVTPSSLIFQSS